VKLKLISALVVFAVAINAQTVRGVIGGVVTDSTAKPVASVAISVTSQDTGTKRTANTDARGNFTVPSLAPGTYRIEAEREGFRKHVQSLTLEVDQEIRLEIPLLPGRITEEVTVTGEPTPIRTETSTLGGVIDNRAVIGLPLDGRNFYSLSLLLPGVLPPAQGSAGSVRGAFAVSIDGAREDANNFLLDGAYNGDPKLNGVGLQSPVDAIREFEVAASTYDASFGRNGGGQINVVTRSGTNQVHGTAYEFFRNAKLDGTNYFAPQDQPDPRYQRNQFGGSFGGPVKKDSTFFFADYEGTRSARGETVITNVPTALERTGDFSQSRLPAVDPTTGGLFNGNKIPSFFQNPIGQKIAALFPLPNRNVAGANFVSSPIGVDDQDRFDVRLDHSLTRSDELFGRYSYFDGRFFDPFGGAGFASVPGYGISIPSRSQNFALGENHVFGPELINDLRLAFNRVSNGDFQQGQGTSINRQVGLPELSSNPRDWGLSLISVNGFSPIGHEYTTPEHGTTNTYQIADNASWTRGQHLVKFGFDVRILQQNAYRDVQSRGFINFTGLLLGNPLEELLLGAPTTTGGAIIDNPQHLRTHSYNFYGHDTWRVRRDLVLTLGVRYEYNTPAVDPQNRANLYNPATGGLVAVGKNGFPRAGYDADLNNFAPTFGFAWSPGGRQTYVLRGAYGIHYDQSSLAPGEGLYFSAPYYNLNVFFPIQGLFNLQLSDPFPKSFPFPFPASATAFQRDLRTPYYQHWNFGIQRQLGKSRVLEVAYVGSKGTHLIDSRDINQPLPSTAQQNLRPNPLFADVDIIESQANSIYHSLQMRFEQRLSKGLSGLVSYTYAKAIDDASGFFNTSGDPNFPQNSRDLAAERGRSDFDVRHRLALSYAYDLPIARGHRWLGGWQSYGVLSFQTGRPFTVALLPDVDNSNTGRSNLGFGNNDRPNVVRNPVLSDPTPQKWFDTSAFVIPAFGHFGNAGRNIIDGPGSQTVDFSIVKNTTLRERLNLQFRAEFFNLLDHDNFNQPDNFVGSATFGQVTSAQDPRRVQFGLKLLF
jgi:hypothetical protein